ncbi:MAG: hypothetical protein C4554_01585 [Dethiobacter sp.]|jgi:hypothetical protein|nr:MAG: hypothetical protein C4554_01585 [Dethiobacter sp.]
MTGPLQKFKKSLGLLFLGFILFGFSFNFSFREGEVIFAYNMNNLGRSITEKLVQSPDFESTLNNYDLNCLRIF